MPPEMSPSDDELCKAYEQMYKDLNASMSIPSSLMKAFPDKAPTSSQFIPHLTFNQNPQKWPDDWETPYIPQTKKTWSFTLPKLSWWARLKLWWWYRRHRHLMTEAAKKAQQKLDADIMRRIYGHYDPPKQLSFIDTVKALGRGQHVPLDRMHPLAGKWLEEQQRNRKETS
jgi:hypothetical protein